MLFCLNALSLAKKPAGKEFVHKLLFTSLLLCFTAYNHALLAGGDRFGEGGPDHPVVAAPSGMVTPTVCNDPLTGKNIVIDDLPGGTACVLCGNPDLDNLLDGDLSNYTSFNPTVTVLGASIVSIKDISQSYDAGTRGGFVIEPQGGLLGTGVLGSFQIRTYLNNVLQETFTGSTQINLNVLGASGGKQRLTFTSTQAFDEVELVQTALVNALSSIRVFYAFVEPAGCDYDCRTNVITGAPYNAAIEDDHTGIEAFICLGCGVLNENRVTDANPANYANLILTVGVEALALLSVKASSGIPIPAGYDAGFVIRDDGLLGLLSAEVLGAISIRTYLDGDDQETKTFASLVDLTVLGDNLQAISFKTTLPFDEIQLIIDGGLVGVGVNMRVYNAFVRPDSDNDGFVDCVDKCAGQNDNLDADGDGIPDGCDDAFCMVNAGPHVTACPTTTTAQLPAAGVGQTWSALPGNPSAASIDAAGTVTGMTADGIYGFVLTEGACTDIVYVNHQQSSQDAACNNPIVGYGAVIDQSGLTGGICLLCGGGGTIVDGNLNDYATYTIGVGVLTATSVISIKDTTQVYPAGRRTGFVIQSVGGLLDATALSTLQIRTYLNNALQEIALTTGGVLSATALVGDGAKQRISFVTTMSFDEVELVTTSVVGALTSIRVFYAFEEPAAGCPDLSDLNNQDVCLENLTADNSTFCGQISYPRSGIGGLVCALCEVSQLGNLIDANPSNYAVIDLTAALLTADGNVAVKTRQEIPAGYTAGFTISSTFNLADVNVLPAITLNTYLNGMPRDQFNGSGGLLFAKVLNPATGLGRISFKTTLSFDEIQLTIGGVATVLTETRVYGAFVYADSDNDGTPDCIDKCCGNPDFMDTNGDGEPNGCDDLPMAEDDNVTVDSNEPSEIDVLVNDSFGDDGPSQYPIEVVTQPANGTAAVDNNGTPADPTDDTIIYTPDMGYTGPDQFTYRICERTGECDVATVIINVAPENDAPVVNPDSYTVNEDTPLSGNVASNDTDPDGPAVVVSVVTPPANGTLDMDPDGSFTYTPDPNYNGPDGFTYSFCDGGTPEQCDEGSVSITVEAGSLSLSLKVQLQGALLGSLDGQMRDDLRTPTLLIPDQEPYTALSGFTHVNGGGGETVTAPGTVFAVSGPDAIVDWVFVELRSTLTGVVATRSALLQRDGDVVDVDGTSPVFFASSEPASYYVAIRHRNHLGAMTAAPVALALTGSLVDFTSLSTPIWDDGTNLNGHEQTTIGGKYALWTANANSDSRAIFAGQNNDRDFIFNQIDQAPGNILHSQTYILNGYHTSDVNMNGKAVFAGQNNDSDVIFNNVDSHPRNLLFSQTFIIREQLPNL